MEIDHEGAKWLKLALETYARAAQSKWFRNLVHQWPGDHAEGTGAGAR